MYMYSRTPTHIFAQDEAVDTSNALVVRIARARPSYVPHEIESHINESCLI